MSEYSFPNLKQARFRDRSYQTNIVRNSVELTENQKILGNGLNYHVITYGCQANVRDGEVISGILEKMGYSYTEAFSQADIIILNTCAIRDNAEKKVLAHIDAVPDNFLFSRDEDGQERIYLIDWEYAGMQDPHIDIAMFGIYSYDREQMDKLIQAYFLNACPNNVRIKIYCYIAACGLLWSNWCEYKRKLGVDFGEYSLRQYRYAKEYYRIVCDELGGERNKWGIQ